MVAIVQATGSESASCHTVSSSFESCAVLTIFAEKPERKYAEALERALWKAIRKLKERVVLHKELVERRKWNEGEDALKKRLEESVATAGNDLKLLREILERI